MTNLQEFSGKDDNRSGAITDLVVLMLGEFNQNSCGRVLHLQLFEDRRTVIGNRHITDLVHHHFIEAFGAQGALNDVCKGHTRSHYIKSKL